MPLSYCESGEKLNTPLIYTPKKLVNNIKRFTSCEYNKSITASERLGYFDEAKNFVTYAFEKALEV